jgi:flagellar biosynthesis/type III secretory pathway chaperone
MTAPDLERLSVAGDLCNRFKLLLDDEFAALREQRLDRFDQLQIPKSRLLADLSEVVATHQALVSSGEVLPPEWLSAWEGFRSSMLECRDLHRRNELLIMRKREAIQGALSALVGGDGAGASVDLYDRLGKVSRATRRNAYSQA